jgi:hypothetical protein
MRRLLILALAAGGCLAGRPLEAATGRVVKVLPEYLDLQGRNSISPSLYERDAYQALLRLHPERRSALRFYVHWKLKGPAWEPLKVRVELRGGAQGRLPTTVVLEEPIRTTRGWSGHWTGVTLKGEEYKKFGEVTAWRVTLWEGAQQLGEQHSFLW